MSGTRRRGVGSALLVIAIGAGPAAAQQPGEPAIQAPPPPYVLSPPPPPATALEAFGAPPGSLLTIGHERLGDVDGIAVEVREVRNSLGQSARGVVVTVPGTPSPQQAFVDENELADLLKGFDQLFAITGNPTVLRNFETSYSTKGELVISASTYRSSGIVYSVGAGRIVKTSVGPLDAGQLHQLRTLIEAASQRLATMPGR